MPRYQLIDQVLFVDAKHHKTGERAPKVIPFPHILDQREDPRTYLKLNDDAAFIARFIVSGVDTGLIPEILRSEFDNVRDPKADVEAVLEMLKPYLKARIVKGNYHHPQNLGNGKHPNGYELDCRVGSIYFTVVKYPTG